MRENSNDFFHNAACGFAAGSTTGILFAVPEYFKIISQNRNTKLSSIFKSAFWYANGKAFAQTAPVFAMYVGLVGAIEFSVNSLVEKNYGPYAGLTASAVSAAFFLTPADQFMLRKDNGIDYRVSARFFSGKHFPYAFTGYFPMFYREWLFGLSVLYLGPKLGEYLKQNHGENKELKSDLFWRFLGTSLTSLVTTTLSQPFDSLAREMQKIIFINNYSAHPRFRDVIFKLQMKELFRGLESRFLIAGFGGAFLGTSYKFFKEQNWQMATQQPNKHLCHSKN